MSNFAFHFSASFLASSHRLLSGHLLLSSFFCYSNSKRPRFGPLTLVNPLSAGDSRKNQTMQEPDNKTIFRRFYERAWNLGDLTVIDELLAPNFFNHEVDDTTTSHRELYKQAVVESRTAFPDLDLTIETLIAEGEFVAAHWQLRGTHTGVAWGRAPSGQALRQAGITLVRVVDGHITDFWKHDNAYVFWQQVAASVKQEMV